MFVCSFRVGVSWSDQVCCLGAEMGVGWHVFDGILSQLPRNSGNRERPYVIWGTPKRCFIDGVT